RKHVELGGPGEHIARPPAHCRHMVCRFLHSSSRRPDRELRRREHSSLDRFARLTLGSRASTDSNMRLRLPSTMFRIRIARASLKMLGLAGLVAASLDGPEPAPSYGSCD